MCRTGCTGSIELAKQAAGDKYVTIGGGADVARQVLSAGLVDELQLHLVPILLGEGIPLFDGPVEPERAEPDEDPGGRFTGRHPPAVSGDE